MKLTERQKDIVNAAIGIIANQGYSEFTIRNLAEAIGLSEAALYRHFESKAAILHSILDYFQVLADETIERIREKGCSPIECVREFVYDRYELFLQNPEMAKVMFSEEIFIHNPDLADKILNIMHVHKDYLISVMKDGQQRGEIRRDIEFISIFRMIVGSMRLIVTQWQLSGKAFDLKAEGTKLWNDIEKIIKEK